MNNMSGWLTLVIILIVLLILTVCRLLLIRWDIRSMTRQMEDINAHFGTNALVRTQTHDKTLSRFAVEVNQLIRLFKQDQQSAERRERELKQEMTNISHDLRTPLTSIKGFSQLLTEPLLSEAERREFLAIIQKKIDHLIMVVDLFYEISQLDSSDKQLTLDRQFLDQLVVETMLLFHADFEQRRLNVQLDDGVVSPIWADKKAVVRIVTNIMQNALLYAKSYFTINFVEEGDEVRLRAVNDAEPMDAAELDRVFQRSFRLDPNRTGPQLGLGLHIVRKLAEKQGGKASAAVRDHEFIIEVSFRKW